MARRAFYSFHYKPDNWTASQVRNMRVIEGNEPATDNDWEDVKKGGDTAIQNWIDGQPKEKSVASSLLEKKHQEANGSNTRSKKHELMAQAFLGSTFII